MTWTPCTNNLQMFPLTPCFDLHVTTSTLTVIYLSVVFPPEHVWWRSWIHCAVTTEQPLNDYKCCPGKYIRASCVTVPSYPTHTHTHTHTPKHTHTHTLTMTQMASWRVRIRPRCDGNQMKDAWRMQLHPPPSSLLRSGDNWKFLHLYLQNER